MSYVTDLVMVFPSLADAKNFERIYEEHLGMPIKPVRQDVYGPKYPLCDVYVAGLNYAGLNAPDLIDTLETTRWSPGTVLYYQAEDDDVPTVTLFGVASVETRAVDVSD